MGAETVIIPRGTLYLIGIDPGTNTGIACWSIRNRRLVFLATQPIHKAMDEIRALQSNTELEMVKTGEYLPVHVIVEDARKRGSAAANTAAKAQGAGSVKRDSAIWEAFLKDLPLTFTMVAPKRYTKMTARAFKELTGWPGKTSSHARDAAMLVYGR